ncbi:hypothetical protein [Undibacterium sp.]|uniref:hypothetical protein n=1 Tax=Undibacterium sp. TaxID=1914977 RepID=UPI003750CDC6
MTPTCNPLTTRHGLARWLSQLDGKQTENANGKKRQSFIINTASAHSITVIDAAGHVDSVGFVVDKRD